MGVKKAYLKTFENPITLEPTTILLTHCHDPGIGDRYSIESLDGEYTSTRRFDEATENAVENDNVYNFLPLYADGILWLIETLPKILSE